MKGFSMVDKVRAIELRKSGKTYKEIAESLNCSIDWCKRSLSGVECVKVKDATFIDDLISLSCEITNKHIYKVVESNNAGKEESYIKKEYKKVRRKVSLARRCICMMSTLPTKPKYVKNYVYAVVYNSDIVYIGKGALYRYEHPYSGKSSSVELNRLFFAGDTVNVFILKDGMSSDEALIYEKGCVERIKPIFNKELGNPVHLIKECSCK
jgi:hypothetical protein